MLPVRTSTVQYCAFNWSKVDALLRRKALLLGGDTAALLAFAAIGRSNHGESLDFGSILSVAWPFLGGIQATNSWALDSQTSHTLPSDLEQNSMISQAGMGLQVCLAATAVPQQAAEQAQQRWQPSKSGLQLYL